MPRPIPRLVALALLGAIAGAVSVACRFAIDSTLSLEMDRELPRLARGFYPPERHQDETFAWTSGRASLSLAGLNRRVGWVCSVRLRGARPPRSAQPIVSLTVDGVTRARSRVTGTYVDATIDLPKRASPGATVTIDTDPTFSPGPSDPRALGVQVDRIVCAPAGGLAWPPRQALVAAALSAAAFGAALACLNLPLWGAQTATLLLAAIQAIPLARGPALYSPPYLELVVWVTGWIALATAIGAVIATRWRRQTLSIGASVAIAFSAGALVVELLALLHPSKPIVDAVFHAHRLDWVLAGRYFFTQPMPSGVQFPYAIALYVVAAPWSILTDDHVALLKIVVGASRALAGLLLYPMVVRAWGSRAVGVMSVVLFHLVPLPFVVIGNANLTYAFGQSMAVAALAVAASWPLGSRNLAQIAGLFAIVSVAFLSHVGLFPLLLAMLMAMAALYFAFGGAALRAPARNILIAVVLAAIFSVISYYGQFWESYKTLARVRSQSAATSSTTPTAVEADAEAATPASRAAATRRGVGGRIVRSFGLALDAFGWALLVLTAIGAWRVSAEGLRNRVGLLLVACGTAYLAFVGFSVVMPVEAAFERYTDEFISRVYYAVMPAVAVLAARGAVWAWEAGLTARSASAVLLLAAVTSGVRAWLAWLE